MSDRRVGLWLIGALGGVGSTAALGLAALGRGLTDGISLITTLPLFNSVDLDPPSRFIVGGHDIRRSTFGQAVEELHQRANVFDPRLIEQCAPDLEAWTANVRPGTVRGAGATIARLAELPEAHRAESAQAAIERIQSDLQAFRTAHQLDQVVVANV